MSTPFILEYILTIMYGRQTLWYTKMSSLVYPTILSTQGMNLKFHCGCLSRQLLWSLKHIVTIQGPISAKLRSLEGQNWPHYNWFGYCPRERRSLPRPWSQRYWPYGQIKVSKGASCFFSFGFHVPRGLETIFQWKWVLHITTGFPLASISWSYSLGCTYCKEQLVDALQILSIGKKKETKILRYYYRDTRSIVS